MYLRAQVGSTCIKNTKNNLCCYIIQACKAGRLFHCDGNIIINDKAINQALATYDKLESWRHIIAGIAMAHCGRNHEYLVGRDMILTT